MCIQLWAKVRDGNTEDALDICDLIVEGQIVPYKLVNLPCRKDDCEYRRTGTSRVLSELAMLRKAEATV
jgi:hypothetical protein